MATILYYDEYICVCDKPRGLLSEGEGKDSLPLLLRDELCQKGRTSPKIYPVHRLDRETEGLMVFALTKEAAAILSSDIAEGKLIKEYLAGLSKIPEDKEGELCDLLFYDRTKNRSYVVKRERRGVKAARLFYRIIEEKDGQALVRVRLYTGRTHQIRVQFASRGYPLVGDRRYGGPPSNAGIALRSCYLKFTHPITKKEMEFERT